jgi:molybdate transport system ATP-binding protein
MSEAADPDEIEFRLAGRFDAFNLDCEARFPASGISGLVGRSGAGKTILLHCLAGLARAGGRVRVGNTVWQEGTRFVPTHRRRVGYVFQGPSLFPHLDVARNLTYARRRARGAAAAAGAGEIVEMLGVAPLLERMPGTLSGGEQQRVAIARALLGAPRLLLMDEPMSGLDETSRAELMTYIERLHRGVRLPIVYVSHNPAEIARLADRVFRMEQGRLAPAAGAAACEVGDALADLSQSEIRALAHAAVKAGLPPLDEAGRPG